MEGLYSEGLIDWASLKVGRKFTVFALLYFVFEGNFQVQATGGGFYLEGQFNGGFFALRAWGGLHLEGLAHGGAYFRNFTVCHFWMVTLKKIRAPAAIIISFPLFLSHSGKGIICRRTLVPFAF